MAIEAIRAQGRRALVAHGWADLALVDDQDDCFVVGEVNQQALFGRVAAVVHHGGAGTTTDGRPGRRAAGGGAPGGRTSRTGPAGWPSWASARHTTVPTPTTESLSAALETALTPETRAPSGRRGRHDPHRRGDGGREAAARSEPMT